MVVTAVVGVLVAIATSSSIQSMGRSQYAVCITNLQSIGKAALLYASDHDDLLPPYLTVNHDGRGDTVRLWKQCLQQYDAHDSQFFCPKDPLRQGGNRPSGNLTFPLVSTYQHSIILTRWVDQSTGRARLSTTAIDEPSRFSYVHNGVTSEMLSQDGRMLPLCGHGSRFNGFYFDGSVLSEVVN
jgi:hypothetical protein